MWSCITRYRCVSRVYVWPQVGLEGSSKCYSWHLTLLPQHWCSKPGREYSVQIQDWKHTKDKFCRQMLKAEWCHLCRQCLYDALAWIEFLNDFYPGINYPWSRFMIRTTKITLQQLSIISCGCRCWGGFTSVGWLQSIVTNVTLFSSSPDTAALIISWRVKDRGEVPGQVTRSPQQCKKISSVVETSQPWATISPVLSSLFVWF